LATGLRLYLLGELTALPRPLAVSKEGEGREMGMRGGKERNHRKQREREIQGKSGKLGIMEYVSRIVSVRYWQPYRLAP